MATPTRSMVEVGCGTVKSAGANLASAGLPSLPATAENVLIIMVDGTLYIENDGTAADANCLPITTGMQVYSNREEIAKIRVFADDVYDARFFYTRRGE